MPKQYLISAAVAAIIVTAAGCRSWDIEKSVPWLEPDGPEIGTPRKMAAIWSDTVYCHAGKASNRGFGGRIYFYDETNEPVAVDGELIVYAFDDTLRDANRDKPDRKYVFPAEDFALHFSPAELGPSYSIWLPWDVTGGEQRDISLVPFFRPKEGQIIVGEPSQHSLPGEKDERDPNRPSTPELTPFDAHMHEVKSRFRVRPASYLDDGPDQSREEPGDESIESQRRRRGHRMQTATINVPPSVGDRWSRDPRQVQRPLQTKPQNSRSQGAAPALRSKKELSERARADRSATEPSPRFQPERSPVPSVRDGRPDRVRGAWQPPRGSLPFAPRGLPSTARSPVPRPSWPTAPQSGYSGPVPSASGTQTPPSGRYYN